ncbi:MAG: hypothetical protein LBU27_03810 [Candidatus Peribacteria bacterium]|jgi:hypothetical protein|nr:hypothetical protein [Candidatus Peribacteria bacterium]
MKQPKNVYTRYILGFSTFLWGVSGQLLMTHQQISPLSEISFSGEIDIETNSDTAEPNTTDSMDDGLPRPNNETTNTNTPNTTDSTDDGLPRPSDEVAENFNTPETDKTNEQQPDEQSDEQSDEQNEQQPDDPNSDASISDGTP